MNSRALNLRGDLYKLWEDLELLANIKTDKERPKNSQITRSLNITNQTESIQNINQFSDPNGRDRDSFRINKEDSQQEEHKNEDTLDLSSDKPTFPPSATEQRVVNLEEPKQTISTIEGKTYEPTKSTITTITTLLGPFDGVRIKDDSLYNTETNYGETSEN